MATYVLIFIATTAIPFLLYCLWHFMRETPPARRPHVFLPIHFACVYFEPYERRTRAIGRNVVQERHGDHRFNASLEARFTAQVGHLSAVLDPKP